MTWSPDAAPDPLLTSWKPTESITITCRGHEMTADAERRGRLFTIGGVLPPEFDDRKFVNGLPVSVTTIHGSAARGVWTSLEVHPGGYDPTPESLAELARLRGDMSMDEFWAKPVIPAR